MRLLLMVSADNHLDRPNAVKMMLDWIGIQCFHAHSHDDNL